MARRGRPRAARHEDTAGRQRPRYAVDQGGVAIERDGDGIGRRQSGRRRRRHAAGPRDSAQWPPGRTGTRASRLRMMPPFGQLRGRSAAVPPGSCIVSRRNGKQAGTCWNGAGQRPTDEASVCRTAPPIATKGQSRPKLLKLAWPWRPITRWSWRAMPTALRPVARSRVMSMSALLGVGSPEGWLCNIPRCSLSF